MVDPLREKLIRAAWRERGSRQWDPGTHGRGLSSLIIQAKTEMVERTPGMPLPTLSMMRTEGNKVSPAARITLLSGTDDAMIDSMGPGDKSMSFETAGVSDSFASKNDSCHGPMDRARCA